MKVSYITDYSVLIGIDWSDKKHEVYEIDPLAKSLVVRSSLQSQKQFMTGYFDRNKTQNKEQTLLN